MTQLLESKAKEETVQVTGKPRPRDPVGNLPALKVPGSPSSKTVQHSTYFILSCSHKHPAKQNLASLSSRRKN
jgi:hypothetical protein